MNISSQQNYNQNPKFAGLWRLSEGGQVTQSVKGVAKGIMGMINAGNIAGYRSVEDGIYLVSKNENDPQVFKTLHELVQDMPKVKVSYLSQDIMKDGKIFSYDNLPINEYFNPVPQEFKKCGLDAIG